MKCMHSTIINDTTTRLFQNSDGIHNIVLKNLHCSGFCLSGGGVKMKIKVKERKDKDKVKLWQLLTN